MSTEREKHLASLNLTRRRCTAIQPVALQLRRSSSNPHRHLSAVFGVPGAENTVTAYRVIIASARAYCSPTFFSYFIWKCGNVTRHGLETPHQFPYSPSNIEKNWRDEGIDQGHCGSCCTLSTTGVLEAAYVQAFGKQISLSEQQLVDCAGAFNNFGCQDGFCKFLSENVGFQVLDSVNIILGDEEGMKHAVAFVRPVSIAFQVPTDFQLYKSGVLETCGNTRMDVNHAVLAVGYGVENGVPYWLIKNSWGQSWGDNGYFKMEYGKNMCGIATCASYPVVA
ncbi:hypothetical protein ACLB2K_000753 [Fragaria x ananassa]